MEDNAETVVEMEEELRDKVDQKFEHDLTVANTELKHDWQVKEVVHIL